MRTADRPRARFARRGFGRCVARRAFSAFLARTMNETIHEVYQQDVWLTLEEEHQLRSSTGGWAIG